MDIMFSLDLISLVLTDLLIYLKVAAVCEGERGSDGERVTVDAALKHSKYSVQLQEAH